MRLEVESKMAQSMPDDQKIRALIEKAQKLKLSDQTVTVTCFDKQDAQAIEACLTPEEMRYVRWTYLVPA